MTDRELLELAAKAAGIEIDPIDAEHDPSEWQCWNPLTDDGDALRLAVKLKLDVFFHPAIVEAHIAGGRTPPVSGIFREEFGRDPYAATRRAITRAAAEIGRSMA